MATRRVVICTRAGSPRLIDAGRLPPSVASSDAKAPPIERLSTPKSRNFPSALSTALANEIREGLPGLGSSFHALSGRRAFDLTQVPGQDFGRDFSLEQ